MNTVVLIQQNMDQGRDTDVITSLKKSSENLVLSWAACRQDIILSYVYKLKGMLTNILEALVKVLK